MSATPGHHIAPAMLLAYGAGVLEEPVALWVATHLALCPSCRTEVDDAEANGGALLGEQAPVPVASGMLDSVLARLVDDDREMPALPSPSATPAIIPEPLRSYTGPFHSLVWERRAPGIRTCAVGLSHRDVPVRFFSLKLGMVVLVYRHRGMERGLVLTGGFTDDEGHFVRGDVSVRGPDFDHEATIDQGEPCVVLFVNDGFLRPRTFLGRLSAFKVIL